MNRTVEFWGNVTSFDVYNTILPNILNYLRSNPKKNKPITFSFEKIEYLDGKALPNIICIGLILKKYYSAPIELSLKYNPTLLCFLDNGRFFYLVGENGLDIFRYDNDYIGGFNIYIEKEYRKCHKISVFKPELNFYSQSKENQDRIKRTTFTELNEYIVPSTFGEVLQDISSIDKSIEIIRNGKSELWEYKRAVIAAISEVLCNAILYSESSSFVYLQTTAYATNISISDIGIGFLESMKRKKQDFMLRETYTNITKYKFDINSKELDDFFAIFECLKYSMLSGRVNLWILVYLVVNNKGTFRIQNNHIQLVFTASRCSGCDKFKVEKCIDCMLAGFKVQKDISSLRFFEAGLAGVHIEIDFPKGE